MVFVKGEPQTFKRADFHGRQSVVKLGKENCPHAAGPAMSSLTPLQQRFVELLVDAPLKANSHCLRAAGYKGTDDGCKKMASRLMKSAVILDARQEMAKLRLLRLAPLGIDSLENILRNPKHPKQMQAINSLLDRAGFAAVQKVESVQTVRHENLPPDEMIARIAAILQRNQTLLPQVLPVVKDGDVVIATTDEARDASD